MTNPTLHPVEAPSLPELPRPHATVPADGGPSDRFTADQMRAYALAALAAPIEAEAVKPSPFPFAGYDPKFCPGSNPDNPQEWTDEAEAVKVEASQAARDVLAERQRQISAEGWTPDHDDEHKEGEMCFAAAGYACAASDALQAIEHQFDGDGQPTFNEPAALPHRAPWPHGWTFKRAPVRRQLVKAGALILAEIERIDRLLARGPICSDCGAPKGAPHNYGCMYSELDV